jgi:hypothetical protein
MGAHRIRLWDLFFAVLVLFTIPAASFHFMQGRPGNGIIAVAAFIAGLLLLAVPRFRTSVQNVQPVGESTWTGVRTKPSSVSREVPRGPGGRLSGWISLGLLSGFVATGVMALVLMLGYGLALMLGDPDGSLLSRWIWALAHNPLTDTTGNRLPLAIVLHFIAGIAWAMVYAGAIEPHLSGPGWRRGLIFAAIPWVGSLVVFLPLMGGGPFGLLLGAGPLPILGNLVLHLVYGLVLGQFYASERILAESDAVDVEESEGLAHTERSIAAGIIPGLVFGALLGLVASGIVAPGSPLLATVFGALLGSAVGALIGSFIGLNPPSHEHS